MAIGGKNVLNVELYDAATNSWKSEPEWRADFISKTYGGHGVTLAWFPSISLEKSVIIFGGMYNHGWYTSLSDIIGLIYNTVLLLNTQTTKWHHLSFATTPGKMVSISLRNRQSVIARVW